MSQLCTTQARISIWILLASYDTHRDALIRALNQIRVNTTTTPGGLIHFLTTDRATWIVFSNDDLPPKGLDHVRPLFIDVTCSGFYSITPLAYKLFNWLTILLEDQSMHPTQKELTMYQRWLRFGAFNRL